MRIFYIFFRPGMIDTALGGVVGVYLGELQHREEMTVNWFLIKGAVGPPLMTILNLYREISV